MRSFGGTAARPWINRTRSNTLEAERRSPQSHRSDEIVRNLLQYFKRPTCRVGHWRWLEARIVVILSKQMARLTDAELIDRIKAEQPKLLAGGFRGLPPVRVAAGIRELTGRKLGMRHHRVQIVGGLALLRGNIVEMATGEGKTITALIPAICAALAGVPVHVVTVNGYLAARDRKQLSQVIEAIGLTTGLINEETDHRSRSDIYRSDVVFSTNKDIAFDYLRDRIAHGARRSALAALAHRTLSSNWRKEKRILSRGLGFAIIDEVDSILIDEAQTPLIITSESDGSNKAEVARAILTLAATLTAGRHYDLNERKRTIRLLPPADPVVEGLEPPNPELVPVAARREILIQALSALHLYKRDEHYIVTDEGVSIVDEFTGRVMADRQWQRGLHQMIEIKENVKQSALRETIAQITYQTFFSRYLWFGGMTGTAREVARELTLTHERPVLKLPTHHRLRRRERATLLYGSEEAKWRAIVADALRMTARGRPVLIGTRSVETSERIAQCFEEAGSPTTILNARQDAEEAAIIARAGEAGRITIATNMAGRGADIPVSVEVRKKGGLHVILTEFHGSARIDRQFIGRTGRQGQPGTAVSIVSLHDPIYTDGTQGLTRLARWLTLGRKGRLPSWIAETLRIVAQGRQERLGRKRRAQTVKRSQKLLRALGFRPDNI